MVHPNIYLLKTPRALGVLKETSGFANWCWQPIFSVIRLKTKHKTKLPCEWYRAKSEECKETPSCTIWRAWNSSRVGKFKAQSITSPRQSHSRYYAAGSGELTSQLPNTEHNWTSVTHMRISPGKQWFKTQQRFKKVIIWGALTYSLHKKWAFWFQSLRTKWHGWFPHPCVKTIGELCITDLLGTNRDRMKTDTKSGMSTIEFVFVLSLFWGNKDGGK